MISDVYISVPAEEVVPRTGRADWLKKWGIPPENLTVVGMADINQWETAGCRISATGSVSDVSDAVADALRSAAREVAKEHGFKNGLVYIPQDMMCGVLQAAREKLVAGQQETEARRAREDDAYRKVQAYAVGCQERNIREAAHSGYDVRTSVLAHLATELVEWVGTVPVLKTYRSADVEPRNSPNSMAMEVHATLTDMVNKWPHPDFLSVSVGRVSRVSLHGSFLTVVPVVLSIPGVQAVRLAWRAE